MGKSTVELFRSVAGLWVVAEYWCPLSAAKEGILWVGPLVAPTYEPSWLTYLFTHTQLKIVEQSAISYLPLGLHLCLPRLLD